MRDHSCEHLRFISFLRITVIGHHIPISFKKEYRKNEAQPLNGAGLIELLSRLSHHKDEPCFFWESLFLNTRKMRTTGRIIRRMDETFIRILSVSMLFFSIS